MTTSSSSSSYSPSVTAASDASTMDFEASAHSLQSGLSNPSPMTALRSRERREPVDLQDDELQDLRDMVWDYVSRIKDPEHDYSLEDLSVVQEADILCAWVDPTEKKRKEVTVVFTPTVPHCSMATLIGLCIRETLGQVRGVLVTRGGSRFIYAHVYRCST